MTEAAVRTVISTVTREKESRAGLNTDTPTPPPAPHADGRLAAGVFSAVAALETRHRIMLPAARPTKGLHAVA